MDDKGILLIPKLTGDNYSIWESKMKLFLDSCQLINVCLQEKLSLPTDLIAANHSCALFHLSSVIDDSIYNSVFKLSSNITPYSVWTALKKKYASKTIFSLCKVWRTWDTIHCDRGLVSYVDRCLECLGEFKTIGYNVTQDVFAVCIISRVTTIKQDLMEGLMLDEDLVSDLFRLLKQLRTLAVHEQVMKTNKSSIASSSALPMDSQVKRPYQHPCKKGHDPKENHSHKNCWYDNPHKKPKQFQSNYRSAKANVTRASNSHDTQAQSSSNNDNNKNAVPAFVYFSIVKTSPTVKLGAILDSGASNHMFNSLDFFVNSEPVFIFIITGDGKSREELVATRKGTALIQLSDDKVITFKNLLFVPNLTRNLVSLSQLINYNISIQRAGKLFNVISNNQEKLFLLDLSNQLFEISGNVSPVHQQTIAMISSAIEPTGFTKWHNRLGHASKDRLKNCYTF
jgi:hypothetical protein